MEFFLQQFFNVKCHNYNNYHFYFCAKYDMIL